MKASCPVNVENPVEQQLENLQINVIESKPQENSLTIANRSREAIDSKKGQAFDEMECSLCWFDVDHPSNEERNVCQEVKGEQTSEIT